MSAALLQAGFDFLQVWALNRAPQVKGHGGLAPVLVVMQILHLAGIYLGSINHTLLSVEALRMRHIQIAGIVFNGPPNEATESIILKHTNLPVILRVNDEEELDKDMVKRYAKLVKLR